jgi:hypothetical protein
MSVITLTIDETAIAVMWLQWERVKGLKSLVYKL